MENKFKIFKDELEEMQEEKKQSWESYKVRGDYQKIAEFLQNL